MIQFYFILKKCLPVSEIQFYHSRKQLAPNLHMQRILRIVEHRESAEENIHLFYRVSPEITVPVKIADFEKKKTNKLNALLKCITWQ